MSVAKISPSQVKIGYFIQLPVNWMKHPFISNKFKVDSYEQIAIIQTLDLDFVYFFPDKSSIDLNQEPEPNAIDLNQQAAQLKYELEREKNARIEQAKEQRRQIQKTEKAFEQSMVQVRNVMAKIGSRPLQAVDEATELINRIADTIINADALVLHLISQAGKDQESLYYHVLNVSVLSMMLAKNLGFSDEKIKLAGLGALFHDMGKLKIPTQILRKTEPLTAPEANLLKLHTKYGVDLLRLTEAFPVAAFPVILQHHEMLDGSGYPAGLKSDQIDELAKVVAVVNEFDNLCHPADPTKARSPHHAMSFLFKSMKGKLGAAQMGQLIKMMGVYPPGTVVMLTDQRVALVMSVNSDKLLYPNVLVYDPQIPRLEAPVITLEEGKLAIVKVLKPSALPPAIYEYLNPRAQVSYYVQSDKPGS
ncbi:HD-GYP domain-containing protein [Rheinheimera riviphila]|uniref:HD-GYP domain-containing protein n=1 Tax=Rheinheimera riviphila TaxID=1834037 RepID=A0A437QMA4_9GAMM|nr:HD-GYP domain-containing protein [Rheinheimera riviphila]RVU35612.1 HD-GYP domain-containing protein [Rheinheimera riviphila]